MTSSLSFASILKTRFDYDFDTNLSNFLAPFHLRPVCRFTFLHSRLRNLQSFSKMTNNLFQDLTLIALTNVYDMHEAFDLPIIPTAEELAA